MTDRMDDNSTVRRKWSRTLISTLTKRAILASWASYARHCSCVKPRARPPGRPARFEDIMDARSDLQRVVAETSGPAKGR
jgi:hypothetical protein